MPVDGVVGPNTWDRLFREAAACGSSGGGGTQQIPPFPGTVMRQGDRNENIRQIQQAINRLVPSHPGRLWRIVEDGVFGPGLRDAVMTVQSIFGLGIDGTVGPNTWQRLMREAANVDGGIRTISMSPLMGLSLMMFAGMM